ncbi:MAG: OprO/OprP family phosphate-selective porin [Bacteroidales bacterium]|nr:OprO/OprP family phosphate-selective porin [Bacteroidales bacterium]
MKKFAILAATLLFPLLAFAQGGNTGMGFEMYGQESFFERLSALEKRSDAFNLYLNFAGSYQVENGNEFARTPWNGKFRARDLRLEIKGTLTDRIYYRMRQKLNRAASAGTLDDFAKSMDIMMVGYRFRHFAVEAGKICQHWGGFDYDENPMYVYQYSDLLNSMDIFFAGVDLYWMPIPLHEFVFEISNPLVSSFEQTYGSRVCTAGPSFAAGPTFMPVTGTRFPVNALVNWNGNFRNGIVQTRVAAGFMTQTNEFMGKLINGGIKFNFPNLKWYVDYMLEADGIDRLGFASADFSMPEDARLRDVTYTTLISKAVWQFIPGWNLVAKGSYDTVSTAIADGRYRSSLMGVLSLEYMPEPTQDFRVFLAATGHRVMFTPVSGLESFNTGRVEFGIMYRIKCY